MSLHCSSKRARVAQHLAEPEPCSTATRRGAPRRCPLPGRWAQVTDWAVRYSTALSRLFVASCGDTDHLGGKPARTERDRAHNLRSSYQRDVALVRPGARYADHVDDVQHRERSPGLQRRHARVRCGRECALQDRSTSGTQRVSGATADDRGRARRLSKRSEGEAGQRSSLNQAHPGGHAKRRSP
jgi:hypothetical protein